MEKRRIGYINTKGEWVVHPQFESSGFFRGGLAPVSIAVDTGFTDIYGQQLIAPDSSAPHNSCLHGYYLDRTGRIAVTPKVPAEGKYAGYKFGRWTVYDDGFSEGLAAIEADITCEYMGRCGYINLTGELAIGPLYVEARQFSEGLAAVKLEFDGQYGFIDRQGELVIAPQFDNALRFQGGLAVVEYSPDDVGFGSGFHTYVNRYGKLIAEPQFIYCDRVSEDRCIVSERSEYLYGCLDTEGRYIVKPQFQYMERYAEGLSRTTRDDHEWGFLDLAGKVAIPFQFEDVTSFHGGLAAAMLDGKWGFIDRSGDFVIKPRYDALDRLGFGEYPEGIAFSTDRRTAIGFFDGLARIVMDDKYFYIDTSGRIVIPQGFAKACDFSNGKALVGLSRGENERHSFVDTHGQIEHLHIPEEYNGLPVHFNNNFYRSIGWYNPFEEGLMTVWTSEELPEVDTEIDEE